MTKLCTRTEAGPGYADPDRVRQEAERRRKEEDRWAPATLLPPEAFSDAEATPRDFPRLCKPGAGTGRHAAAVHRRIMSSCAGWRRRPTAKEFYEAVRATRPTVRQQAIVDMWGREATFQELLEAWAQRAPTANWCGHSISPTSTAATESARSTSGRRSTDTGHDRRRPVARGEATDRGLPGRAPRWTARVPAGRRNDSGGAMAAPGQLRHRPDGVEGSEPVEPGGRLRAHDGATGRQGRWETGQMVPPLQAAGRPRRRGPDLPR